MNIMDVVLVAGYVFLASIILKFLAFFWVLFRGYVLTSFGLVKNIRAYGEWAVITGATGGIGNEYARQLAQKGFNIVLISRTLSKLENVAKSIEAEHGVKTKVIAYDFTKCEKSGYENIEKEVSDLDVGILVNNVGMAQAKIMKYAERSMDTITNLVHTNVFGNLHMTHMVLKGMVERKRGIVVHVSAGAVYFDNFPLPVYSATKIFITTLVKSLQCEYPGVIEHQTVLPFGVATNMGGTDVLEPGMFVLTADDYVKKAIRTIGVLDYVHGCIAHEVIAAVVQALPKRFVTFMLLKTFGAAIKKLE